MLDMYFGIGLVLGLIITIGYVLFGLLVIALNWKCDTWVQDNNYGSIDWFIVFFIIVGGTMVITILWGLIPIIFVAYLMFKWTMNYLVSKRDSINQYLRSILE